MVVSMLCYKNKQNCYDKVKIKEITLTKEQENILEEKVVSFYKNIILKKLNKEIKDEK